MGLMEPRAKVVWAAQQIYRGGLVEAGEGNISIRNRGGRMYITPTYNTYAGLELGDIVCMDLDGHILDGDKKPSAEHRLHAHIYRTRDRAGCVIHTHSPYATALSVLSVGIPVILEEMVVLLGGGVKVASFSPAHTGELGWVAVEAMGRANAVLLANHGVVVCARTPEHAVKMAELVEKVAEIYTHALSTGLQPRTVPEDAIKRHLATFEEHFATY